MHRLRHNRLKWNRLWHNSLWRNRLWYSRFRRHRCRDYGSRHRFRYVAGQLTADKEAQYKYYYSLFTLRIILKYSLFYSSMKGFAYSLVTYNLQLSLRTYVIHFSVHVQYNMVHMCQQLFYFCRRVTYVSLESGSTAQLLHSYLIFVVLSLQFYTDHLSFLKLYLGLASASGLAFFLT